VSFEPEVIALIGPFEMLRRGEKPTVTPWKIHERLHLALPQKMKMSLKDCMVPEQPRISLERVQQPLSNFARLDETDSIDFFSILH
jgi:hypothetical protein